MGDHQERCLKRILTTDEDGIYPYSTVLWSDIKKSAKSTIAAAVALYIAWHHDDAEVYLIANDLKQADSRVAHYFRRSIEINPEFRGTYRTRGYKTTFKHNRSFVEALPIDPTGEAGSNADLIVFSELWGANQAAQEKMWSEMTLSPTKFGKSFRWIESYAGYKDESQLLYSLYEQGISGEQIWPDLEAWEIELGRMFCLWNTRPRLPWQTPEYYATESLTLDPDEFERMHRNQWMSSVNSFVPAAWWNACEDHNIPPFEKNEPIVVALDAAVSGDCFGMVAVSRHPTLREDTVPRYIRKWTPPRHGKINFQGTEYEPGPEMELERLAEEYNVVECAYDPEQLEDMAGRISRKGRIWMRAFDQGTRRLRADSNLRNRIRDKRIHHSGDPDLKEHIQNANAKTDVDEHHSIRIVKRDIKLKIDLAVALSMADYECMRLNLE